MITASATGLTSNERPVVLEMLKIQCPFCGERDYTEFRYGGDARKQRPERGSADLMQWHDYVFLFDNPKGRHEEFWQHVLGCRQWLVLERNTATNHPGASRVTRELPRVRAAIPVGEAVAK
jgi:heterotetrameric sarcosine oxidase delta subunit